MDITDDQHDALTEILNIAIGRAANSLNQMVKEEIVLSIPEIGFLGHDEAVAAYQDLIQGQISAIKQRFESSFSGDALLIFPERQSLTLVQHILGDLVDKAGMTELELETMSEVGNVVLNACLSSLADQLQTPINSSLPEYLSKSLQSIFRDSLGNMPSEMHVLIVKVNFRTQHSEISGYIMLIVDILSANTFLHEIDAYVDRVHGRQGATATSMNEGENGSGIM